MIRRLFIVLFFVLVLVVVLYRVTFIKPSMHPKPVRTTVPAPLTVHEVALRVDGARMMGHVQQLANTIGVRRSGSEAERKALEYIAAELRALGYTVHAMPVPLPNGRQSVDVIAELPGVKAPAVVIGAHVDSKSPSPGANDDASGVAVLLELARVLKDTVPDRRVVFVAFGAEEIIDRHRDHHHFGSRALAADAAFRAGVQCMTSLDMVGAGEVLHMENQGWASDAWRDQIARCAKAQGLQVRTGRSRPTSDHEAFERRGIPVAYLHRGRDAHYHKSSDKPAYVGQHRLVETARVMVHALLADSTHNLRRK